MQLPGLEKASILERKVVGYLLAFDHPTGRHKAAWLGGLGFRVEAWEALADEIKRHAATHEVARVEDSPFGRRFVIEGPLMTPDGHNPFVRAVWFIEHGEDVPRLVTLYPLRGDAR